MTNAACPVGGTTPVVLAAGENVIAVPTGAVGVVISPPTSSTNAKTGPTPVGYSNLGLPLRANAPILVMFDAAVTQIALYSAGIETLNLHWL